jgi:purine-binding chemotaxis protein CheW
MSVPSITETGQYLSFKLEEESFALDISNVREVLDCTKITRVPQGPEFMLGVVNLRGGVVPVVDMRRKFGMGRTERTRNTCIIMEVELDGQVTVLGALADSVQEVMEIDPEHIEPAPRIGIRMKTGFVKGMGRRDEQFIIILDINKVFSAEELAMVNAVEEAEAV